MKSVACLVVLYLLAILLAEAKNHNVTDMIKGYGYPCEDHLTEPTSDGWKLSLQRIPYGKKMVDKDLRKVLFSFNMALLITVLELT